MGKPRYMEELLKIIFLWLGILFIVMGSLCFIGILKPTADSMIRTPAMLGIVYSLLGFVFFIVSAVLKYVTSLKTRLHNELLVNGTKVHGTVEKVHLQRYTQYGNSSPYRILYTYTFQGRLYHHKSCLLWDKPDFRENDPIDVYANSSGKSTVWL